MIYRHVGLCGWPILDPDLILTLDRHFCLLILCMPLYMCVCTAKMYNLCAHTAHTVQVLKLNINTGTPIVYVHRPFQ